MRTILVLFIIHVLTLSLRRNLLPVWDEMPHWYAKYPTAV